MSFTPVASSKFYIGTQKPCVSAADYAGDTYTQILGINSVGDYGDVAEEIKFQTIDNARVNKLKGARDAGNFDLTVGFLVADAGQIAMRAAAAAIAVPFNFKAVLADGSVRYLSGNVMSAVSVNGEANAVQREKYMISLTAAPILVPAGS